MQSLWCCPWVDLSKRDDLLYHAQQWGVPLRDDRTPFEFFLLDSAQAGLSRDRALRKRENYRQAVIAFEPQATGLVTNHRAACFRRAGLL